MRFKNGEFQFGLWDFVKTGGVMVGWLEIENKLKKNNKRSLLEVSGHWAEVLRRLRGPQVHFIALGRMTYSHFLNRIFI